MGHVMLDDSQCKICHLSCMPNPSWFNLWALFFDGGQSCLHFGFDSLFKCGLALKCISRLDAAIWKFWADTDASI